MKNEAEDPIRTPRETADQLGVEDSTLAAWRTRRTYNLKYVRVGGRIRYRQSDIDDFLQSRTVVGTEGPNPDLKARPFKPKTRRPKSNKKHRGSAPRAVRP
jgi:hypothetical protein